MIREAFATPEICDQPSPGPEFSVHPPAPNTFVFSGTIDVIKSGKRFDLMWRESEFPTQAPKADEFLSDALARSQRDVERFPTSPRARTNLAVVLMHAEQTDQAIDEFETALKLDSSYYSALAGLAAAKLRQGDFDHAENVVHTLRERFPHSAAAPVMMAFIAMQRGLTNAAIDALREAISLDSKATLPRYLLGMVLMSGDQRNEAISQLRTAARLEPRSPVFQRGLGIAFAIRGDLKRAVKAFQVSYALAPFVAEAAHSLATVLMKVGRSEAAAQVLSDYLTTHEDDGTAQELLARACREQSQFDAVRRHLLEALRSLEADRSAVAREARARLKNNIGAACFALDSFTEADSWFKKSLAEIARPTAFQNLYAMCLRREDMVAAEAVLRHWLDNFPSDNEARAIVAIRHAENGDRYRAIRELRSLVRDGVNTARVYGGLGALLSEDERLLDEALEVAKVGCERFPDLPEMFNNLAYVHLVREEPGEAKRVLELVHEHVKRSVHLTATCGLLKLWEGDVTSAQELYKDAAQLARKLGRKKLGEVVRQKMYLELARYFCRAGKHVRALAEIASGLKINGNSTFREKLIELRRTSADGTK